MKNYYQYENYPRILDEKDAVERSKNKVIFRPGKKHRLPFKELEVALENVFDLAQPTIDGLFDDLVPGSKLMEEFMAEWEKFQASESSYGIWVFYPAKNHLVRFVPLFWHRLSLLMRNSTLHRDPEMKMEWQKIRELFEKTVVAIAGCSVGNNAAHAIVGDIRPFHLKVADYKEFEMPNANRVRLTYADFYRNKALVTAEQINAVDPFMRISVFNEGVHEGNISDFIIGNKSRSEPPASFIVEETDDPDAKILIRKEAKRNSVPVIMVTDMGSAVQLDIRRFDLDNKLPLAACGVSDEELFSKRDRWQADLADRNKFFEFAFALIGHNHLLVPEFKRIILKEEEVLFGGIPQLGSTAMMAGGMAAEAIARIILGSKMPERMFINKYTGEALIMGDKI
ncbi:MAG: ThiF family adenylyltransferase [Candidatus Nealsonbacteria bacterium]|nr:ThiF family adenylyltransferase [Candidatus Nealsonbacteria bacterium]